MSRNLTLRDAEQLRSDKVLLSQAAEVNNQYTLLQRSPSGEFLLSELRKAIADVHKTYLSISVTAAGATERLAETQGQEKCLNLLISRIESHESRALALAEESMDIDAELTRRSELGKTKGTFGTPVNKDAS